MIYHNRSEDTGKRIDEVIADAVKLMTACSGGDYENVDHYKQLRRAMTEQTITDAAGTVRLRTKADGGMDSGLLQNPSDPDATYREKNGNQHRGYTANVIETVDDKNQSSIITDYKYEQNTYSDSRFLNDALETLGDQPDELTIVTDGAYGGEENQTAARKHNINLVTTDLVGRKANDIYAEFTFSDDGKTVTACAAGIAPKSCGYNGTSGQCRISYYRDNCVNCIHKDKCRPKIFKRTAVLTISQKTSDRAKTQRLMKTDEHRMLSRFRNGVESIPSVLRRKYKIDTMPVRTKVRTKLFFGFKIAALNFRKMMKYFIELQKNVNSYAAT